MRCPRPAPRRDPPAGTPGRGRVPERLAGAAGRSRWPVRLGLVQPGQFVLCAVADPSSRPPEPKDPDYLAESGRGLHVISALSDRWGSTVPTEAGKVVWALFSVRLDRQPPDWGWFATRRPGRRRAAQCERSHTDCSQPGWHRGAG